MRLIFNPKIFSDPPRVSLKVGSNINTAEIVEDSDVYFDCIIDANPAVYKVEWNLNVSKNKAKMSCTAHLYIILN